MIWNRAFSIFCLLATVAVSHAQELTLVNQIDIRDHNQLPKQEQGRPLEQNGYFTTWLTDSDVVTFSRDLKLRVTDTSNSNLKWTKDLRDGVRSWSIARSNRRLAISTKSNGVAVFNCDDGSTVFSVTSEWLSKKTSVEKLYRVNVTLSPIDGRLIVANFSPEFGPHSFLFSNDLNEIEREIDTEGWTRAITTSADGKRLVSLAWPNFLNIREIGNNGEVYRSGEPATQGRVLPNDGELVFIDAFHDGQDTLIYSKGGLCFGNGEIAVYSMAKKVAVVFDSLSGWVDMDVDFRSQKIAVYGSSAITVFDFEGKVIASLKDVPGQPFIGIEFSPNTEKIMIYNRDEIRVFRIGPAAKKNAG